MSEKKNKKNIKPEIGNLKTGQFIYAERDPVIDDKKIFIGIVTRKDIIRFCYEKYIEKQTVS